MLSDFLWCLARRLFTFHVTDAAIAFAGLNVRGVENFEGDFFAMTAAFVQHLCTHDCAHGQ